MKASRLLSLPPYLFEELENRRRRAVDAGRDVIDLSIGDPDLSPPQSLISHLASALDTGENHRYPRQRGAPALKASIRRLLSRRCGVEPDDDQILVLIGSKEGLAHLPWAVCDPGDTVLIPDPCYPVYRSAAAFAGCEVVDLPLTAANGFLPRLELSGEVLGRAKLCFLNYPNNPTGACADAGFLKRAVDWSAEAGVIVANDAAYSEVYFGGHAVPLLCGQKGALDHPVIELFSFSKTYSITGWRVGFAVGHREVIEALAHLKANIDSGVFTAVQDAVSKTLDTDGDAYAMEMRRRYERRHDTAVEMLDRLGFHCFPGYATFYLWIGVPSPWNSMDYAMHVLERADVLVAPGIGFGAGGEGYFRIALTQPVERLEEAFHRLARL